MGFNSRRIIRRMERATDQSDWAPATTAHLAARANVPDATASKAIIGVGAAGQFLAERDQFAGVPGKLSNIRAQVLEINDPAQRAAGLEFIDWLQQIPQENQESFLAWARGNNPNLTPQRFANEFGMGGASVEDAVQTSEPGEESGREVVFGAENASIDRVAMMKSLFPDAPVRIGSGTTDETLNDIRGLTEAGVRTTSESLLKGGEAILTGDPDVAMDAMNVDVPKGDEEYQALYDRIILDVGGDEVQNVIDTYERYDQGGLVNSMKQIAYTGAAGLFGAGNIGIKGAGQAGREFTATQGFTEGAGDLAEDASAGIQAAADKTIGAAILAANPGMTRDDPEYQDQMGLILLFASAGLAHGAARVFKARKVARGTTPDSARAELRLDEPLIPPARSGPGGALLNAVNTGISPIRAVGRGLDQMGYKLGKRTPTEALTSRAGRRNIVNPIMHIMRNTPAEERIGAIQNYFGERYMPNGLAERINKLGAGATPEAVTRIIAEHFDKPRGPAQMAKLRSQTSKLRRYIERIDADGGSDTYRAEWETRRLERDQLRADIEADRSTGVNPAEKARRLHEVETEMEALRRADEELPAARLRLKAQEQELAERTDTIPLDRYPRRNIIRAATQQPTTKAERVMHFLTAHDLGGPMKGGWARPDRFVAELPRTPRIGYGHVGWKDDAATTMRRYLETAGVGVNTINRRMSELAAVDSRAKLKDWIDTSLKDVARQLPPDTPPEVKASLARLTESDVDGRSGSIITEEVVQADGRTRKVAHGVLETRDADGGLRPKPSMSAEFRPDWELPDIEAVIEWTSNWAHAIRKIRRIPVIGRAGLLPYDMAKAFFRATTGLLRGPALSYRMPAMGARIQAEQAVRNIMLGHKPMVSPNGIHFLAGGIPVWPGKRILGGPDGIIGKIFGEEGFEWMGPDPRFSGIGAPTGDMVGGMVDEAFVETDARGYSTHDMGEVNNGRPLRKRHIDAVLRVVGLMHDSPEMRMLAAFGGDVDKLLRWMDEVGPQHTLRPGTTVQDILDEIETSEFPAGVTDKRRAWAEGKAEQLRQQTLGGDPDMMNAVATGRISDGALMVPDGEGGFVSANPIDIATGRPIGDVVADARVRLEALDAQLKEMGRTPETAAVRRELQTQRREAYRQIQRIKREHGHLAVGETGSYSINNLKQARRIIRERFERGEVDMPQHITVQDRVIDNFWSNGGSGAASELATAYMKLTHAPLKALGPVDLRLTRGSLYYQIARIEINKLRAQGLSRQDALAVGTMRASNRTVDAMYDLAAKTPIQRAMKDIFWFAPAWQEVMYTWAVKIPSESYWPIGAAKLAADYAAINNILIETGIIQEDQHGDKYVVIPGVGKLVDLLPGVKAPDDVVFDPGSLNFVSSGGEIKIGPAGLPMPSPGTGGSYLIGKAALEKGGVFKTLSDVFQPYGPETTVGPAGLGRAWEIVFGTPAPWELMSPQAAQDRLDRVHDNALRHAASELWEQGIKPPRPEDYFDITDPGTEKPGLSPEAEAAYNKAATEYHARLMSVGRDYSVGMGIISLLGSTVSLAGLRPSAAEQRAWEEWREENISFEGGQPGYTDAEQRLIAGYIREHPGSLAYTVGYSAAGVQTRELAFPETENDAVYDEYLEGRRVVVDPETYATRLMYTYSRRSYDDHLTKELNKFAPPGKDQAYDLLSQGYQRQQAVQDYKLAWDRYKVLTPGVDAFITEQNQLWASQSNQPQNTYMVERYADAVDLMRQLGGYFTGESGLRSEAAIEVAGQLSALYGENNVEYGGEEGMSRTDRAIGYFYDEKLIPYLKETGDLYDRATELTGAGLTTQASAVYDQIDDIRQRYDTMEAAPNGAKLPSLEEYSYGNRSPEEQRSARLGWATRPPQWLSEFQKEKVGINWSPETTEFFERLDDEDARINQYIIEHRITSNDTEYDNLMEWRDQQAIRMAKEYGPETLDEYYKSEAPPIARLAEVDEFASNPTLVQARVTAETVANNILNSGSSLKGYSEASTPQKLWFFRQIETHRQTDEDFNELLEDLGYAMPLDGGEPRRGAVLYDAVFFGQFNETYIPEWIREEIAG